MKDLTASKHRFTDGFTLVELLVAMVIISILLATGIPALTNFNNSVSVRATSDQLLTSLGFARTEAVSEVTEITICATANANGDTCGGSDNWNNGWIVFVDANADGLLDAGEELKNFVDISRHGVAFTATAGSITFDSKGENLGNAVDFTLSITDALTRNITVSEVGYVSLK